MRGGFEMRRRVVFKFENFPVIALTKLGTLLVDARLGDGVAIWAG
jgi:hypothetical protein